MIFVYKFIVYICLVVAAPFLPLVWLFSKKRRANLVHRFGFNTGIGKTGIGKTGICKAAIGKPGSGQKRIWVHALSVGETVSCLPFVRALKLKNPSVDIVFTASTKTGFDMAKKLLQNPNDQDPGNILVEQLGFFPFDIGYSINRVRQKINPDAVVMVETDLWPNFLYEMKKHKVPVILINARLSKRSLKGYLKFAPFAALMFSSLRMIMAQSMLDKERFRRLGIPEDKVKVTGNIKFDQPATVLEKTHLQALQTRLGLLPDDLVFIAGSTHTGEEEILLAVYQELKSKISPLKMIIAPRNPERAVDVQVLAKQTGACAQLLSQMDEGGQKKVSIDIILVDKMGELSKLYAICDVAFIGGSLVARGGHNPLEAAAVSKPIVFGPDMSDFMAVSKLLADQGGARQVESKHELCDVLEPWLKNAALRSQLGKKNYDVFCAHSGAVEKIIQEMEHIGIV